MRTYLNRIFRALILALIGSSAAAYAANLGDTQSIMSQRTYTGGSYGYVWITLTNPSGTVYTDPTYPSGSPGTGGTHYTNVTLNALGDWYLRQYDRNGQTGSDNLRTTSKITVVATTFTISTSSSPSNGGSTTGGGTLSNGTNCTVKATPTAGGWTFNRWQEGGTTVSTSAGYTFTVTGNRTLVAYFDPPVSWTLNTSVNGSGSISPSSKTVLDGTTIYNITATPATGWSFGGWSGALSGTANPQNLLMNGDKTVTATFNINYYSVAVSTNGTGSGSVSGAGSYAYGTTPSFTATATTGSYFAGWSGAVSGSTNPVGVYIDGNKSLTATFNLSQYTLTTGVSGTGTVTAGGTYPYGTVRQIAATPGTGQQFTGWSGAASGTTNPINVTIDSNKTLTANFSPFSYTVSTSTAGAGSGTVTGGGTYTYGATATMTATPATGSYFVGWSGAISGTTNPQGFTVTGNATVTATFGLNTHTVSTATNPTGLGTVTGGGNYTYGQIATLSAPAVIGYTFSGWSGGGLSGPTNPVGLTVRADTSVTATYTPNQYTLSTKVNGSGTVTPGGSYPFGTVRTIEASPATGHHFTAWSGDFTGSNSSAVIVVDRNKSVTANFAANIATVTVASATYTYDGQPKSLVVTTDPAQLSYVVTYNGDPVVPSRTGDYRVVATVTDPNYQGSGSGDLKIVRAKPQLTWARPRTITYPSPLSETELNATANVAGHFVYTPASGTVLQPGKDRSLSVEFTPDDAHNYETAVGNNSIDVLQAPQSVTVSPAAATVSAGATVVFSASGGQNGYEWGGSASGTGPSQNVLFPLPGRFDVNTWSPEGGAYLRSNTAVAVVAVEPVAQAVTLQPATVLVEPDQPITLTARGGMNGYVWGGSASGSGDTKVVSFSATGRYGVTVFSPAGGAFRQSNEGVAAITVARAQAINFPPPGSFVMRAIGTNLVATASSGLPVRFSVVSGPGALSGNAYLRFGNLGAIVVQADQDGDSTYSPALPVRQTVYINAPPDTTLQFPTAKSGLIHADHQDTNHALPQPQ